MYIIPNGGDVCRSIINHAHTEPVSRHCLGKWRILLNECLELTRFNRRRCTHSDRARRVWFSGKGAIGGPLTHKEQRLSVRTVQSKLYSRASPPSTGEAQRPRLSPRLRTNPASSEKARRRRKLVQPKGKKTARIGVLTRCAYLDTTVYQQTMVSYYSVSKLSLGGAGAGFFRHRSSVRAHRQGKGQSGRLQWEATVIRLDGASMPESRTRRR